MVKCKRLALDTTLAKSRLSAARVGTDLNETMKNAAAAIETQPIEIMKVLLLDGYSPPEE